MKNVFILLSSLIYINCNQVGQKSNDTVSNQKNPINDSILPPNIESRKMGVKEDNVLVKTDLLTKEESNFLTKLTRENESIVLSNKVRRYFADNKDNSLLVTEVLFNEKELQEKGYVYLELKFYGKISEPNVYYEYSMGQANWGYGSIVGNDTTDYIHTTKSCGLTACVTQVFQKGQKIFEKTE